jgi:Protein of unknown function (DUF3179)
MRRGGWTFGTTLALAVLVAVAVVAIPIYLIRPFSPQTATTVAVAYRLRAISPWLAPAATALAALCATGLLLRRPRWPFATLVVLATLLAGGAAWLSHQNHFEWMFAPLKKADYARVREATFVDDADMVIAVELNGDAVAYPIRQMAYHHVLNDEVGGIPVVSTY